MFEHVEWRLGPSLDQHAGLPQFSFEKHHGTVAVAANSVLGTTERATSMEHVAVSRIEIQCRCPVFVAEGTRTMWVGFKMSACPCAYPFASAGIDDELDF